MKGWVIEMGLEELIKRYEKDPEWYKDVLLKELNEAYSDLRSCLASALTLLSTIIALMTASIALKAWWLSLIALLLAFCSPPLVVYTRRRERDLELVKRVLYGDPVGSWHYGLVKIYIAFSILILAVGLILLLLIP